MAAFSFIEGFCIPHRRHSALGSESPVGLEAKRREQVAEAGEVTRPEKRVNSSTDRPGRCPAVSRKERDCGAEWCSLSCS